MSQEVEPATKAVHAAAQEFDQATGALDPGPERTGWLADAVRHRRAPQQAKLLTRAAAKVRQSGLPATAVSDKLLRAVLEDGAMEDAPAMQGRWANLLANAAISPEGLPASLPSILRDLVPAEAHALNLLVGPDGLGHDHWTSTITDRANLKPENLDNLERLGLIRFLSDARFGDISLDPPSTPPRDQMRVTALGVRLVLAWRAPGETP